MALKTPYATILQANSYLKTSDAWSDLSNSDKDVHLLNGRYYMDANYTCTELLDTDPIPEEYVYANSLLAEIDMTTGLFIVDKTGGAPVVQKMSKAGPVEVETTYAGSRSTELKLGGIDPYPQITALLSEFCTLNKGSSGVKVINLLRA